MADEIRYATELTVTNGNQSASMPVNGTATQTTVGVIQQRQTITTGGATVTFTGLTAARWAEELGFAGVMSGPLVRSSYRAGRLWVQAMRRSGRAIPEHLRELADHDYSPARQEAATLVASHKTSSPDVTS